MAKPEKKNCKLRFTWKLKKYLTLKFQEKILSGRKNIAPPMMLNGLSLTIFSLRSSNYGPKYINNTAPFMICCNQSDLSF